MGIKAYFEGRPWLIGLSALLLVATAAMFMPAQAHREGVDYWQATVVSSDSAAHGQRTVKFLSGPLRGETAPAGVGSMISSLDITPPTYTTGDSVLVSSAGSASGSPVYTIIDYYRIPAAVWLFVVVIIVAVVFAGWRGLGALAGLVFSVVVLAGFVVPQILHGNTPYLVTAIGIMVISLPGIYLAHGVSRRTSLALLSTYASLLVAVALSFGAVYLTGLSGISSEDIWLLSNTMPDLNIRGLLLCGLLISLVGILDDITVGQTAAIYELHRANPKLPVPELYRRGLKIGREHIASLINTLVLVYVGASFVFIVYLAVMLPFPLLVVLNSEFMMEEIVRGLVGSAALVLAVPIATFIAARFVRPTAPKSR